MNGATGAPRPARTSSGCAQTEPDTACCQQTCSEQSRDDQRVPEPSAAIQRWKVQTMKPVVEPAIGGTAARISPLDAQCLRVHVGHETTREARSQDRKWQVRLEMGWVVIGIATFQQ